jgi:template-activating factor I
LHSFICLFQVEEFDDIKSGYRIKLHFDENPFFTNDTLVKEFYLGSAEPTSTSTEINWKENMNLNKRDTVSAGQFEREND